MSKKSKKQKISKLLAVPVSAADVDLPLPERKVEERPVRLTDSTPNTTPQTD